MMWLWSLALAAEPALLVSGTIQAPAQVPAAKAIFVSLRQPGVPGPPLAAKRLEVGSFPMAFTLTEADRPMVQGEVPAELEVKVTLDVDGDPMKKSDTDLEAVVAAKRGATGVVATLAPR